MKTMISFQCDTLDEARAVIDAVAAIGKAPHACSKQYVEPEELNELKQAEKDYLTSARAQTREELELNSRCVEQRKNINPGDPTITKIGTNTKESLLAHLKAGGQPTRAKFDEHLKLLWKRGEIKFDGEEYYV